MRTFIATLALGALALLGGGASAASSAQPSLQHYMIGFGHSPNASDTALVKSHGGTVRYSFSSIDVLAVDLPSNQVNDVKKSAGVSYVEADPVRTPLSLSSDLLSTEYPATATNGLYGLVTTHAVEAQAAGYMGAGVKACVADTGLDTRHPDIAPNLVNTHDVFNDTTGLHATDVYDLGVEATETHATHVSGIMLGAINGIGIHGVAPQAKLYEARVLGTQPDGSVSGETSQVMAGAQWLADQGCKVINMSLGGGDRSQSEEALYNQIRKDGTLIVVASGNEAANHPSFPGRYQSVVTVGAVDQNNTLASFSNTGAQLDLVAPGVNNLSSFPEGPQVGGAFPEAQGRDAFVNAGGPDIAALPLEFAGATSASGVNNTLVKCGLAQTSADCGVSPPAGFVALIQRGAVSFAQKVKSAMAAGAGAAIIYNNAPGNFNGTLGTSTNNGTPWIPAVSLSQADGQALATASPATATVFNIAMGWNFDSGTSMATPHVSGVAALILGKDPKLTPDQVETIMERTTTDLGVPNYDTTYGWGLVNAQAALAATP
jgi:subtilisin family serine protease